MAVEYVDMPGVAVINVYPRTISFSRRSVSFRGYLYCTAKIDKAINSL